jgi:hypothetical protein
VDQLVDALAQGERGRDDEHAEGRDQRPEVGFPSVPQRMLSVSRAAAATLSHVQGQVVPAVGQRVGGLGRQCGGTGEDRRPDLGQRDPEPRPECHQYGPRAVVRHRLTSLSSPDPRGAAQAMKS